MGSPQVINCTVSTVSGVESSSVMISWMGPGGSSLLNDSRVTINPTTSISNTYTSSLHFVYLMEGDEGIYTCNVMILEANGSQSVELQSFVSKLQLSYNQKISRAKFSRLSKFLFTNFCDLIFNCTSKFLL